ncbi:MAG: trypsin-like peptidase domain-containing protein [Butyrivibrio sp.]|nr:trypsin-like peptidase domain-containing protein [Butyrivibrio sp.]
MKNRFLKLSILFTCLFFIKTPLIVSANGPTASEIASSMLSTGLFDTPILQKEASTEEEIINAALMLRPSCVQIRIGNQVGSGSIIKISDESILILTAKHVVKNWENEDSHLVIFFDGLIKEGGLVDVSEDRDLAVIKVETDSFLPEDLIRLRSVPLFKGSSSLEDDSIASDDPAGENSKAAYDKLKNNSSIVFSLESEVIPDPLQNQKYNIYGNDTKIADGYVYGMLQNKDILVTDFGYNMLYAKCSAHEGMSGGGVFDQYGNYVALLSGGSDDNEMVATSLPDIISFLETIKP